MHFGNVRKIYRLKNGILVGTAGDSDARSVLAVVGKATPRKMPSRADLALTKCDGQYLAVFPKGQAYVVEISYIERDGDGEWGASVDLVTDQFVAIGHGYQFAYGALESGKSAMDSVRIACKRDITCALPVQWESIKQKGNSDTATKAIEPVLSKKRR